MAASAVAAAPFVEIDGRRFHADRCYLNEMAGASAAAASAPTDNDDDEGVQLFSRARLVAALAASEADGGLEACILTTYNIEVPDLVADFPALFGPDSRVPTLLLHGDRRVRRAYAEDGERQPYRVWKEVVQENSSVEMPRGYQRRKFWSYEAMDPRIQVQQVVPYFPQEPDGSPPKRSMGTFHPKICLLVTRTRLVVVVSTGNLVPQASADLSWVQAFPRRPAPQQNKKTSFGRALTDLLARIEESLGGLALQCRKAGEGEAVVAGTVANGPLAFLQRHVAGCGGGDLDALFDFSAAAVDLVTSVPIQTSSACPPEAPLRYGLERMTQLLKRRAGQLPAAVHEARRHAAEQQEEEEEEEEDDDSFAPPSAKAPAWDRLRVQVTSATGSAEGSCRALLDHALSALLSDVEGQWERHERCELFWPSLSYIKTSRRFPFKNRDDLDEEIHVDYHNKKNGGSLFFIPEDCLDLQEYWKQMRCFELHPRVDPAAQRPYLRAEAGAYGVAGWTNVPPHLKTFSRGLPPAGSEEDAAALHGEPLAWLWLTSCNLSAGALGWRDDKGRKIVKNFEAGVLFHSGPAAVYRAWPTQPSSSSPSSPPPLPPGWPSTAQTIYLPLPFRLDAPHYTVQDPWDPTPDLLVPPFFHSHHGLHQFARLRRLEPQIEAVFARVREDLKELSALHGLDARGCPLPPQSPRPLASVDGNVEQGREEKRLKAAGVGDDEKGDGGKSVV